MRFTPTGDDVCRVDLTHRGWEAVENGAEARGAYDAGWPHNLARVKAATEA